MNLKLILFTIFLVCFGFDAAADPRFLSIKKRQYVTCGTSIEYPELATKKDGVFQGFDADICRAFAAAILGDPEQFRLVPIKTSAIGQALNSGQIDVMLGHTSLSSSKESAFNILPIDTLYIDRQIFASRTANDASSMRDFTGATVCVTRNSDTAAFLKEYNQKYALNFKIIEMPNLAATKEAFYINRCELITGSEIFVRSLVSNLKTSSPAEILPEEVAYLPITAYSSARNPELNTAFRWVLNALKLAYAEGIGSQTISTFKSTKSPSLQNLLGITPKAWQALGLDPDWASNYISAHGNYHQILEHNFGSDSAFGIDLGANDLIGRGGFLSYRPFL